MEENFISEIRRRVLLVRLGAGHSGFAAVPPASTPAAAASVVDP